MNINQLRYFISVATARSFSAAAEENYITQTAMTQQIKALEDSMGCQLINRSTRPITLTAAGQSFLKDARSILSRLDEAMIRAAEASSGISGSLRIGYIKGYERSALSDTLRSFHRQLPNVLLTCYRDTSDRLASGLHPPLCMLSPSWLKASTDMRVLTLVSPMSLPSLFDIWTSCLTLSISAWTFTILSSASLAAFVALMR